MRHEFAHQGAIVGVPFTYAIGAGELDNEQAIDALLVGPGGELAGRHERIGVVGAGLLFREIAESAEDLTGLIKLIDFVGFGIAEVETIVAVDFKISGGDGFGNRKRAARFAFGK